MCCSISRRLGDSLASITFRPPSLLTIGASITTNKRERERDKKQKEGEKESDMEERGMVLRPRKVSGLIIIIKTE